MNWADMTRAELIRKTVAQNLDRARMSAELPGLKDGRLGKVRHVYRVSGEGGTPLVIVSTSDRVSVFDVVQDRAVPYKGAVLNAISRWAFEHTADIVSNALLGSAGPHVLIQRELANIGIECVVRGYLWGGLASDYERGLRTKCGVILKDGLWRYQQLNSPIFTPTTKTDRGHDQDVSPDQMAALMEEKLSHIGLHIDGPAVVDRVRDISFRLYQRGRRLAERAGLILVDTKYEFGLDLKEKLYVIDEIHTPDSSRYVEQAQWDEKWESIQRQMSSARWETVGQLLQERPDLKIPELSKQLIRDVLLARGYDPRTNTGPGLRDDDLIELAGRYIELYERLTRRQFDFKIEYSDQFDLNSVIESCSRPSLPER
jgi:phosphoribosylaminoimidazole-succinocarboxamide synthase